MNFDHDFVQVSKLSEDQKKKRSSPKMEHFSPNSGEDQKKKRGGFTNNGTLFSPNLSRHLRSDAHQSQIIRRDADVDHTQTIGGDTAKLLGDISPPGFGIPAYGIIKADYS